ncbi:Histidine biosynthesis trifunctional protein [Spathaspora sp. JA1]|nr:Histidine biosynthesis trifunctional protein [Spathaspora sp. JA1]
MRHELNNLQQYRHSPQSQSQNWSSEFKASPSPVQQNAIIQKNSPVNGQWATEFSQPQQQHQPQQHQPQQYNTGMMMGGSARPMMMGMGPMMGASMQHTHSQQSSAAPIAATEGPIVDWDNQFKEIEELTQNAKEEVEQQTAKEESPDIIIDDKYQATFQEVWDGLNSENFEEDFINQQYEEFKHTQMDTLPADLTQWERDFARYVSTRAHFGDYQFEETKNNQFMDLPKEADPYEIGLQLMENGAKLSEAALAFEAAIQRNENHIDAWLKLGEVQTQNEKEIAGISALEKCLELNPENLDALMTLAISYINEGYDNAAFATLERWISTKYPQISARARQENPTISDEDRFSLNKRVSELFIQAAQLSPDRANMDADVQMGLGVLFYANEDFDKTIDCFKAALSIRPNDAVLWNRLGASLANSNRSEEAVDAYFKALQLKPTFVRARYNLGVSCINIGCYKEAAEHLLKSSGNMSFPILPLISSPQDSATIAEFSLVGQVLFPWDSITVSKHWLQQFPPDLQVFVDATTSEITVDEILSLLNTGVKQVFIPAEKYQEFVVDTGLPTERFAIEFNNTPVSQDILQGKSSFTFNSEVSDLKLYKDKENRKVYIRSESLSQESTNNLVKSGYIPLIPASQLTTKKEESNKISISSTFISTLTTDRPDGLYTTLITTPAPSYTALGIVYSSKESIAAAIEEKVGVYQSRKRPDELWYKGKTSGATQTLVSISKDCDSDVVKFIVNPKSGYGFCHVESNFTCFGDGQLIGDEKTIFGQGLAKLDITLASRLQDAPEGSYTQRLFKDEKLLVAKLKEELDELIEAKGKEEVAWECADLLYFAMVWCIKNGVRLSDIERNLDIKSMKVTRRKGDAKPAYIKTEQQQQEVELDFSLETIKVDDINANSEDLNRAMTRPVQKTADIMKLVLPIIEQVKKDGDKALIELTAKFDGVKLTSPVLNAPFPAELMQISEDMKHAIDLSISNIEKFHAAQLPKEEVMTVETSPGVFCSRFAKPIENVGLYVPGGTAVLPSTAMMLGVPAKVAGCKNIIIASPPARATGKLTPEVVYVAHRLGAKCIVMAGGAQAVTAMAYGTESVLKCDKILGPGNQFVTAAKMYVQNDTQALCSIDMPAGPSEVLVIADEDADADFVASDLLSQAEHGIDSQVILIGVDLSEAKLKEYQDAVKRQAEILPRKEIVAKCLSHSFILLVKNYDDAFELSNKYAPEHLILQIENAKSFVPKYVDNAGSVFIGALSPESCGDYSSGTNHTLPTYGYARQYSGVNTATYQKFITAQDVTKEGLESIGKAVMTLAAVEGLEAHRRAVEVRMEKLGLI